MVDLTDLWDDRFVYAKSSNLTTVLRSLLLQLVEYSTWPRVETDLGDKKVRAWKSLASDLGNRKLTIGLVLTTAVRSQQEMNTRKPIENKIEEKDGERVVNRSKTR